MIDMLKRFFGGTKDDTPNGTVTEHDVRVAACALFLEMGGIDGQFSDAELNTLMAILKDEYGLSGDHADALVAEAETARKNAIDYWRFAERINENYSKEEKIEVVEILWRIVFVDGKMDEHENYLMHKLGKLLRLSHQELMDAKVKVLHS